MEKDMPSGGTSTAHSSWIEWVQDSMRVVDSEGEELGTVEVVRMGDPEAVTTAGNEPGSGTAPSRERDPDAPEPRRSQLIRNGYLKVDAPGLIGASRYIRADEIANVTGDTVILTVSKDELSTED